MRSRRIKIQRCDFSRVRVRFRSISLGGSLSARLSYSWLPTQGEGRDLAPDLLLFRDNAPPVKYGIHQVLERLRAGAEGGAVDGVGDHDL